MFGLIGGRLLSVPDNEYYASHSGLFDTTYAHLVFKYGGLLSLSFYGVSE